ncbi:MAG: hypothetical protein A2V88_03965 [Elusimicrobia bacterium RBG_16_66_12]|nr:MAG: hypothetical protein A2V88_03965 [Elusimicrobia bacterium RBG_16_66_12]
MAAEIDVKPYVEAIIREISIVTSTLKEKGAKRFGRAFVLSGFLVFASYAGVYKPPQKKSARLADEIKRAKMMSDYSNQYKGLRDSLDLAYANLPATADREQWLSNSVRDSLNTGGLVPEDFRPMREDVANGLVFQTATLSINLRFSEFFDWLLRLESAKPMMHLASMEFVKKGGEGYNHATFDVSTVVPVKRYR